MIITWKYELDEYCHFEKSWLKLLCSTELYLADQNFFQLSVANKWNLVYIYVDLHL